MRAFGAVGGTPPFIAAGSGARVTDADGRSYIDLVASWGPLILGHAHPAVVEAVMAAAANGFALGATHPFEIELGEAIQRAMPSMERLRFTSSGTEAVMSALRVARAATSRDLVVKFAGAYHGHSDGLLVEVHHQPEKALSDGVQSILPEEFAELCIEIRLIAAVVHREVN